jgi:hypothetical protein
VAAGVASGAVCGVIDTLDQLDTSAFYERSLLGGVSGADPDMLLTLLVYGVPPSFRTADRLGSIPERRGIVQNRKSIRRSFVEKRREWWLRVPGLLPRWPRVWIK